MLLVGMGKPTKGTELGEDWEPGLGHASFEMYIRRPGGGVE